MGKFGRERSKNPQNSAMKWFIGLAIIFVLFAGTSLSIRITAPGRHFHRRSAATNQGFIQAHNKFTQTLSHISATIQEAREGLSEMKQTDMHMERSDTNPQIEEVETSEEKPKVVQDAEKEGTCLHPKDLNCKSNEKETVSKMDDDKSEVEVLPLDVEHQEIDGGKSDTIIKVELENVAKIEDSADTKFEIDIEVHTDPRTAIESSNSTEIRTVNSTEVGNSTAFEARSSTEIEVGNSTEIEVGNSTEIEIGNSTDIETGNGTEIEAENITKVEHTNFTESHRANLKQFVTENQNETSVSQEKTPSEIALENVAPSEDRSDEIKINQIIVDEEEFHDVPTKPQGQPSNSSFFAKFFKIFKDNSHILGL